MDSVLQKDQPSATALGRGVYDATETLRLLNFERVPRRGQRKVSYSTLRRWLLGYEFGASGDRHYSPPLWRVDYALEGGIRVSFRDLAELRFVKAFRDLGLSLPTIRRCFQQAIDEIGDDRPFSSRKFKTDGKTIFLEITRDVREGELVDLRDRQTAFRSILQPSLKDFDFDADGISRWFPMGQSASVRVDPARAFGRPVVAEGVPTIVLAEAVEIEGSEERAAKLYEVSLAAVRESLEFERKLAA